MLPTLSLGSTKSSRGTFCECKHDLTGLSLTAAFSVWLVQTRSTAYVKIWQSGSSRGGRAHFQGEKGVTALCPKSSNFRQHCQPQRAFSGIKYFFLFFLLLNNFILVSIVCKDHSGKARCGTKRDR